MDVIVIGTGGLAREFSSFFSKEVNIVGFSSNNSTEFENFSLCGQFFGNSITPSKVGTKYAVLAIGSPITKKIVFEKLKNAGFEFPNIIHPSVISATNFTNSKSQGIIISPYSVIGSNVQFANNVYINFMVGVGHDTKFESYIQVNPGAQIGGAVSVGQGVVIGSSSVIREGLKINKASTVGSGSVVLSSVREGVTVIGNPAKRLKISNYDQ
ncbi:hypothetical protein N9317_05910 [Pelagibacteraceae bacterium]|nr:hypothetical protein [Pelagibacteraceae bacterium]